MPRNMHSWLYAILLAHYKHRNLKSHNWSIFLPSPLYDYFFKLYAWNNDASEPVCLRNTMQVIKKNLYLQENRQIPWQQHPIRIRRYIWISFDYQKTMSFWVPISCGKWTLRMTKWKLLFLLLSMQITSSGVRLIIFRL